MKEEKNIYEPFALCMYKLDEKIDTIRLGIYICNSMIENLKYRGKYILMKGFKFDISEIINIPPIANKKKYEVLTLSRFLYEHEEEILNFASIIETRFSKDDLVMFHKNIKTLKMKIVDSMKFNGYYDPYENYLVIKKERVNKTLPHELFHVTTSRINGVSSICGFHYLSKGISIGMALNEGYTDIMANRYFDSDISCSFYSREIKYYDILEDIIGKDKLEKYYMNANLVGIIKELSQYRDEKDVVEFIIKTDDILRNERKSNKKNNIVKKYDITNKMIETNLFLASLNFDKNNNEDLTKNINTYDKYSKLYIINENNIFKNIYIESLKLYNSKKKSKVVGFSKLEELYEIIGYEKLETVCFKNGIRTIINELIKYTNLDEIYDYLKYLDSYTDYSNSFNQETFDKIREFNFSLEVCKSRILDDVQASVNSGFQATELFYIYRNTILKCLKENKNVLGDNDYFDYDDASRLYEIIGKEDMLRYYISGDIDSFRNSLSGYKNINDIMRRIDSEDEKLKEFLDSLEIYENSCKHM